MKRCNTILIIITRLDYISYFLKNSYYFILLSINFKNPLIRLKFLQRAIIKFMCISYCQNNIYCLLYNL
ncbi:hypothetical protein HZS_3577 [Henneguya salminicola]|nr:hypothetical protein HZS_3577 [Henneguya salminicola]